MSALVETARDGRVSRLTLVRPEKRNALNAEACRALLSAIGEAERDPATGSILLTAHGKAFCAGMDLSEIGPTPSEDLNRLHDALFTVGARLSKPLIGAVRGAALGGGTGLVANCHIVMAGEDATFGLTEIRLGLWPFLIHRAVLAALGERRTTELALTGRIFGAHEAREMGLVQEVAADPEARAAEVAHRVAAFSRTAVSGGLEFLRETRNKDWQAAGEIAWRLRNVAMAGADFQEGVRAFREKRPPQWPSMEQ
jgi:enoyl-CoA hydratase/carnithine racemase